jgi:hypothetical protein
MGKLICPMIEFQIGEEMVLEVNRPSLWLLASMVFNRLLDGSATAKSI